jgi:hypothetical protein
MADQTRRDYYNRRLTTLDVEFEAFRTHYKELSEHMAPRRGRFEKTDVNKGTKRHKEIINSRGSQALNVATAGIFAGVMSPTRPWFDLVTPDPGLMQFSLVKEWLRLVRDQMLGVFNASNLYNMAPVMIQELLLFGTGCMTQVDDPTNLARFYTHTAGSYRIAQNERFEVTTIARRYRMSAEQMALEFGKEKVTQEVKTALSRNNLDAMFDVVHFIEPNDNFRPQNPLAKFKKFSSVKFQPSSGPGGDQMLSESGFDEFPAYCPRWGVTGEDTYGTTCPGMVSLGDVKQLQIQEKRKAQAIDKMVNPPLVGPGSIRNIAVSGLPGSLNLYDGDPAQTKLESLYTVDLRLGDLKEDMDRVERRIDDAFFVSLFLAITNMAGVQPRNQLELSERNGERLLQLGPVLERMQSEALDLIISRTFSQMVKADMIPPPPPELQGMPLKVTYISSLAQAQRAVDTRGIDRLTEYVGGLVGAQLSDGKKINFDKAIEKYGDLLGTPPTLMIDDQQIAQTRQAEQQAAQAAQGIAAGEQLARTARDAGQVDLEGENPVSRVVEQLSG